MTKSCYFCKQFLHCRDHEYANITTWNECEMEGMDGINGFTPNADWLEYIKLLDDQIAFREKTVNDLYERDCRIKELQKENEELKKDLECMKLTVGTLSERPYLGEEMKCKYYSKIQCDLCFDIKDSTSCCKDCIKLAICEDVCIYWKKHIEDEVLK